MFGYSGSSRFHGQLRCLFHLKNNVSTFTTEGSNLFRTCKYLQCWKCANGMPNIYSPAQFRNVNCGFHTHSSLAMLHSASHLQAPRAHGPCSVLMQSESCTEKVLSEHYDRLFNRNDLDMSEVAQYISQLLNVRYQELYKEITWLQPMVPVAFIQLAVEGKVQTVFNSIQQHPNYKRLCQLVEGNMNKLNSEQLTQVLLDLLHLGTSRFEPFITKLFLECRNNISSLGCVGMYNMSSISKIISIRLCFTTSRHLMHRLDEVMNDPMDCTVEWTAEHLHFVCRTAINLLVLMARPMSDKLCRQISRILTHNAHFLNDPHAVGAVISFADKVYLNPTTRCGARPLIKQMITQCEHTMHTYMPHIISQFAPYLRQFGKDSITVVLRSEMESFALYQLTGECTLWELSDLLLVINELSPSTQRKLLALLHNSLKTKDIDLLTLASCGKCLMSVDCGTELLELYQNILVSKADQITSYPRQMLTINKFLMRHRFVQEEHRKLYTDKLLSALYNVIGWKSFVYLNLAPFILVSSKYVHKLPEDFVEYLLSSISTWSASNLFRVALAISGMKRLHYHQLEQIKRKVHRYLAKHLEEKADSLKHATLHQLLRITNGMNFRDRNPLLTEKFMRLFLNRKYQLSQIIQVGILLQRTKYDFPVLYDMLVQLVIEDFSDSETTLELLKACSDVNHQPSQLEDFVNALLDIYSHYKQIGDTSSMLFILYHLSIIGVFPEKELCELFSLKSIKEVENYIGKWQPLRGNSQYLFIYLFTDTYKAHSP